MYLVGAAHPHKSDAQRRLERLINDRERLVTDAEVLQEILHRYVVIKRLDAILRIVDEVIAINLPAVEKAKQIVLAYRLLSARDAVHLAVMEQRGISRILSLASGFDTVPGVTRIF
jgi:predicted nucleic acid-binding protein